MPAGRSAAPWIGRPGPLPVAIAVAIGIALAPGLDRLGVDAWPRWLVCAAVVAGWHRRRAVVLVAGLAFGAARGARPEPVAPPGVIADDRIADRVTGVVRGPIVHGPHGDGALVDPAPGPAPGPGSGPGSGPGGGDGIWLWSSGRLVPGEQVVATGLVHAPRGLRDPAVPDHAAAIHARGARLELTAQQIVHQGDAGGLTFAAWRWADATQRRWTRAIDDAGAGADPLGAAALRGIVAGDRGEVPAALDDRWRAVGIFHVLSVSGLHLAVVAGLAYSVLRRLVAASPWGGRCRPARWAAPPALVLAVAYTMITGAQLATLRSLAVIALVLIAQLLDRPLRLVDALGLAALAILAWRPADLLDPSFQLSFVAALTLAMRPAGDGERARGVRGWLVRGIASSAWVALTTAPLTAYHFHQIAVGGVVGNLVLTPAVELVALPLGLAGAALGLGPAIALASWIVGLADRGAGLLAQVTPVGHVAIAGATTMVGLTALALWLATRDHRAPGGARGRAIAWAALCLVWTLGRTPPPAGALRVTFLDVGQGDAAVIELPGGAVWLIDAGGAANAGELAQAAAPGRAIDRVIAAYGHARIDLAILSHPHPDHYLGLAGIETPIDELWTADEAAGNHQPKAERQAAQVRSPPTLPGFAEIAAGLAARGTRIVHPALGVVRTEPGDAAGDDGDGDGRASGDTGGGDGRVELVVWAPRYQPAPGAPAVCATDPVRTVNDNSLIVALRYRGRTILFAGDLEAEGEDDLVAAGVGPADIVKVPHHGSPTSSTARFVAATHPQLAVISCGRGNAFGFPSPAVVARWQAAGAAVARTDRDGAVTATIDATGSLEIDRFVP
ncbi:MAG TPA: ComEC/Rec2 family competence protein [Kofleriaceae bacterium]|nr:ComEC/Rec2 family competence protein [Kofleriaceae bacterium]